jgi:hypothetical protein
LKAVDSIVALMKKFPNKAIVQHDGSYVLDQLSKFEDCRPPIVAAGGRRALMEALDHPWEDPNDFDVMGLKKHARDALQKLLDL